MAEEHTDPESVHHNKSLAETLRENHSLRSQLATAQAEVERLRAGLIRACSMLDDAVQFRDDAEKWFVGIDELRRVAIPYLRPMAGYEDNQ